MDSRDKGATIMTHPQKERERTVATHPGNEGNATPGNRGRRYRKYDDAMKRAAVDHYLANGRNMTRTMRELGYPSGRGMLAGWIDLLAPGRRRGNLPRAVVNDAVLDVASGRATARETADGLGVSESAVRNWMRRILTDSGEGAMDGDGKEANGRKDDAGDGVVGADGVPRTAEELAARLGDMQREVARMHAELEASRKRLLDMEIEIAVRQGALELLGKGPGAGPEKLGNADKALLVRTTAERYGLSPRLLFAAVGIARSTYYHQLKAMRRRGEKEERLLALVREVFENCKRRYGYRRIRLELRGAGVVVSARRIMRVMSANGLRPVCRSAKRYSSYKGEIGDAPANLVARDFHADRPNVLWVTDITEFSIPAGKIYLSPVVDCHDGWPVAWTIGTSPNADLANGMLRDACATLRDGERPVIHSDRGCHYRWNEWVAICREHGLTRSMSAKGCSPDNAAAEGFFGRVKQEFFHKRSFDGVTVEEFVGMLDEYLTWYREERIKTAFGTSIAEYRRRNGFLPVA